MMDRITLTYDNYLYFLDSNKLLYNRKEPKENLKKSKKNGKKSKMFPWWCKIVAYILSFSFAFVCLFFIIIQGISLGDDKVKKWLASMLISVFTSVLITQPIQV